MGFCEFQAVKFSQGREIYRCTRKRQGCTRNRHTSGRGSPPKRSIRLCACGTLRTAAWYNERLNLCGGERDRRLSHELCTWILSSSVPEKRMFWPSYSLINSLRNALDSDLMQIQDAFKDPEDGFWEKNSSEGIVGNSEVRSNPAISNSVNSKSDAISK